VKKKNENIEKNINKEIKTESILIDKSEDVIKKVREIFGSNVLIEKIIHR